MDFIHLPPSPAEKCHARMERYDRKSSSSDETESRALQRIRSESPSITGRRKYVVPFFCGPEGTESKVHEVALRHDSSATRYRTVMSPRAARYNRSRTRYCRNGHSQKLSHSAGELESPHTDASSETPRVCVSAQEFEGTERLRLRRMPRYARPTGMRAARSIHALGKLSAENTTTSQGRTDGNLPNENGCNNTNASETAVDVIEERCVAKDPTKGDSDSSERTLEEGESPELERSICGLEGLKVSSENGEEEEGEGTDSDAERRPASILRRKSSEGRRELHSILKHTAVKEEKQLSRTPSSILKHRESSSEEKEPQPASHPDPLHSILKKSTSEEEGGSGSGGGGPDIRPILKNASTDEDSPGGRPRPILKKRTSFSDECSYSLCPDLKPILKKKTAGCPEEQPKPILKSRRKSEGSASLPEFGASRPRAYSADAGVKFLSERCDDRDA